MDIKKATERFIDRNCHFPEYNEAKFRSELFTLLEMAGWKNFLAGVSYANDTDLDNPYFEQHEKDAFIELWQQTLKALKE